MAFEESVITAGLNAIQTALNAGQEVDVAYIQVGTGRTTPTATDTGIETPFSPVKSFDITAELDAGAGKIGFLAEDNTIGAGTSYDYNELVVFLEGDVPVYRAVETDTTTNLGSKADNERRLFAWDFDLASNLKAAVSFSTTAMKIGGVDRYGIVAMTSAADLRAGTRTDRVPSVADVYTVLSPVPKQLTDASNIEWDLRDRIAYVTLGGNRTFNNPTNPTDGATYYLDVIQDGTGNRLLTWGSDFDFSKIGGDPTLSTGANERDLFVFRYVGSKMVCVAFPGGIRVLPISEGGTGANTEQGAREAVTPDLVPLIDAANIAWDVDANPNAVVTLGGNRAISNPITPTEGRYYLLSLVQDGNGNRTVTWGSDYVFTGIGGVPTLSTGAGERDKLAFVYEASRMRCLGFVQDI